MQTIDSTQQPQSHHSSMSIPQSYTLQPPMYYSSVPVQQQSYYTLIPQQSLQQQQQQHQIPPHMQPYLTDNSNVLQPLYAQPSYYNTQYSTVPPMVQPTVSTAKSTTTSPTKSTPHANDQSTRGYWSRDEDARLAASVDLYDGKSWKKIAEYAFGGSKTDVQCLHRWQKVLRPGLVKVC